MAEGSDQADPGAGIPAATLILFSEDEGQVAKHLMIQRTSKMNFAPGAMVFPGGRVDEDDHMIAGDPGLVELDAGDPVDRAHRVAAIREIVEEVGVLVGFASMGGFDPLALQASLKQNVPFSSLLRDAGARLDLAAIVPWAQWHPKFQMHRRFDTRFYIARHDGDHAFCADIDEVHQAVWLEAREAVAQAESGKAKIIYPTLCNLERLAEYPTFDAAVAHAATLECLPISPVIAEDERGERWISIPEGSGYPITSRLMSTLTTP